MLDMLRKVSIVWSFLTFILPFVTAHWSRRHQEVALRARGDVDMHKRQFSNARFTFYDVGLGACGVTNIASDWIVALNVDQYGNGYPGPYCFQSITIQYGGKTAEATIMDECMGCPYGGLDFSRGLFDYFADESMGVLYGTWWFNNGNGGGQTSSTWTTSTTWEAPTTTSTPAYTPPATTSYYTPPSTTSSTYTSTTYTTTTYTSTTTTTTTTTTTSSTTSSTSTTTSSAASTSGSAAPTGGGTWIPDASNPQNILVINKIVVALGITLSVATKTE